MAWEFHKVEVAWQSQPDATFPIYTDETSRVDPGTDIVIVRGGTTEIDTIEPSTLSLAFNNPDHRFTPGNVYSPLYPNVKPARKIRVSETIDGVTYYLFTGYIQFPDIAAWAKAAPGTKFDQTINITAVDRMGRLDRAPTFRSTLGAYIRTTADLVSWYPLDEATPKWRDAFGTNPPITSPPANVSFNDGIAPGGGPIPTADDGGSAGFTLALDTVTFGFPFALRTPAPARVTFPTAISTSSGSLSVTYWSTRTADTFNFSVPVGVTQGATDSTHSLEMHVEQGIDGLNLPTFNCIADLDDGIGDYPSPNPNWQTNTTTINAPNLITMRFDMPSKTFSVWVNDFVLYSQVLTGTGTINTAGIGAMYIGSAFTGSVAHIQIRNGSTWGFADHVTQWQLGRYGLARQTPGQRIATVLGYAGVAAGDMRLDSGTSIMVSPRLAGRHPSDAARDAANTDVGKLFCAGDGAIVFHDRDRRYNAPVAATIDLSWLSGQWQQRIQQPINVVTVTAGDGTQVTTRNAASALEYGEYAPSAGVVLGSAVTEDADNYGAWLTTNYADPRVRAPAMQIDLIAKTNTIRHTVLGREISDRIAMSGLPANAPEGIGAQFIEGVTHHINTRRRTVTFNTSPLVGTTPGVSPTWPVVDTALVGASTLIPF